MVQHPMQRAAARRECAEPVTRTHAYPRARICSLPLAHPRAHARICSRTHAPRVSRASLRTPSHAHESA
eukprot:6186244-Pleurochrysis_carterae.AAC.1